MKNYLVMTFGGRTLDDSGKEVEHCTYLGFTQARSRSEAIEAIYAYVVGTLGHDYAKKDMFAYPTE